MSRKSPLNWTDLPVEMQWECIKHLEFKSRMRLRATAKAEKSAVESAPKYHFDTIDIEWMGGSVIAAICQKSAEPDIALAASGSSISGKGTQFLMQVLKFSDAEQLSLTVRYDKDVVTEFLSEISKFSPFHFNEVNLCASSADVTRFFMENLEDVEVMKIGGLLKENNEFGHVDLMDLSLVINSKLFQNRNQQDVNAFCDYIEKWIERDSEVGKTLQVAFRVNEQGNNMKLIAEKLQKRIVYEKPSELRIRTDNESKHVLVRAVDDGKCYVSFVFIPVDQLESEYEKDDKWAEEAKEENRSNFLFAFEDLNVFDSFLKDMSRGYEYLDDDEDLLDLFDDGDFD